MYIYFFVENAKQFLIHFFFETNTLYNTKTSNFLKDCFLKSTYMYAVYNAILEMFEIFTEWVLRIFNVRC